jgi:hypothetical protein
LLPVGFQTDYKSYLAPVTKEIDEMIEDLADHNLTEEPFLIPWSSAKQIIKKIEGTLKFEEGYSWDVPAFLACMQHLSKSAKAPDRTGMVWCIVRKNRNISRFVKTGHAEFSDAPDTSRDEGKAAREIATDVPALLLLRQNGKEAQDWRGAPFYWPVLITPGNTKTAIFASDVVDED